MHGIPPRERAAPSPFQFYKYPNAPPNSADATFEAVRWPSYTWFGETEEEDSEITIGHFWTDLMDLPAGLIEDNWPSAPNDLIYDVEEDEWLKVVMVERQRPRPDFDRAYLVRRRAPSQTCLAEIYGDSLPILYQLDIDGFHSEDDPLLQEFWEGFNRTFYCFPVMHEAHRNTIGSFPWVGITATGEGTLTDYYRAPDAMASTLTQPFTYMLGLYRKGNLGTVNLPFVAVTPGGDVFDVGSTVLYLRYVGQLLGGGSILKYSNPNPLLTTNLTLNFESLAGGAGLASYPNQITVQPISHAPCPSFRFTRDMYFTEIPDYPMDHYNHFSAIGTLVYGIQDRAGLVLYQTDPGVWEGFWSSYLAASTGFFSHPGIFEFVVHLTFTYPDLWTARLHNDISTYTRGADNGLVAIYQGQIPTNNLPETTALKRLPRISSTGIVSDPPDWFIFR